MKYFFYFLVCCLAYSCIPVRVAPTIKEYKLIKGKKFKRSLPRDYSFIFEDTKKANEFYTYLNVKYNLKNQYLTHNIRTIIDGQEFFISFCEVQIQTKKINVLPWILDRKLENEGIDPIFDDVYTTRIGHWYIVLTLTDSEMNDALHPNHKNYKSAVNYLRELRNEYMSTSHYIDILFKK